MDECCYIIGSGPTGVSAAKALLDRGLRVTMLDAGITLEKSKQAALDQTSSSSPADWNRGDLEDFKSGTRATAKGIALKLAYGSDFPYRGGEEFISRNDDIGIVPSLAQGGLSNVWGAAMLPYLPEDTGDWPFNIRELDPHYRAVLALTGLAAHHDDLAKKFPLFIEPHDGLRTGSIVRSLLDDLNANRDELAKHSIAFGHSRLAVAGQNRHGSSCDACRMCMFGCPLGLIYNSADTLRALREHPNFSYQQNIVVKTFREVADHVEIKAYHLPAREDVQFQASRLFIAAGTLATTRLVLESLEATNASVTFKDSQYFLLPLLRNRAPAAFDRDEPQHTLSQAFIEIFDREVSEKSVHLQVYGYNDLYREAIKNTAGPLFGLGKPIVDSFLKRFVLLQGYLHSDYSHEIEGRLLPRDPEAATARLALMVKRNEKTEANVGRVIKKLRSVKSFTRAKPLSALLKMGSVGRGFHTGGSLPMRSTPGDFQTDLLGTPHNCRRVHVVDSSVFPTVPASTITLTAMANAHRIASQVDA
jgi:choline dehydrogenase-like flavoprotein